jgi:hypothetical protein
MQCGKPFFSNTRQNGKWTFWNISNEFVAKTYAKNKVKYVSELGLTYMFYTAHWNLKDEENEIEEKEINAALKRVLILLDQVNDLSKNISKPNYFICINFKSHHIYL